MQFSFFFSDALLLTRFPFLRSAKQSRIDSFLKLIAPFGILESARTGLMALPRSPLYGPNEDTVLHKDADEVVDASQLPPG
jgi:acetolactate synthase-1/3 small subunit